MKKIYQIRRLRKGWKVLAAAIFAIALLGGYMLYANAATSVAMRLSTTSASIAFNKESNSVVQVSSLTGTDDNGDPNRITHQMVIISNGHLLITILLHSAEKMM